MKYVIFDGDCGICNASAKFIERNKNSNDLVTIPSFDFDFNKYAIPNDLYLSSVIFFDTDTNMYSIKMSAIKQIAKNLTKTIRILSLFLSIPLMTQILNPIYDLIAKNRASISRMLKMNACKIK